MEAERHAGDASAAGRESDDAETEGLTRCLRSICHSSDASLSVRLKRKVKIYLNVYALPRVFHGFARLSHTIRHGFVSCAISLTAIQS